MVSISTTGIIEGSRGTAQLEIVSARATDTFSELLCLSPHNGSARQLKATSRSTDSRYLLQLDGRFSLLCDPRSSMPCQVYADVKGSREQSLSEPRSPISAAERFNTKRRMQFCSSGSHKYFKKAQDVMLRFIVLLTEKSLQLVHVMPPQRRYAQS